MTDSNPHVPHPHGTSRRRFLQVTAATIPLGGLALNAPPHAAAAEAAGGAAAATPRATPQAAPAVDWDHATLRVGWAVADLTPTEPIELAGQFNARISEGILDPISATAMAFESTRSGDAAGRGVLVSCDLVSIPPSLTAAIEAHLRSDLPELDPKLVVLHATHTHTAPQVRLESDTQATRGGNVPSGYGVELEAMDPADYSAIAARRIADAVIEAWRKREPAAVGYGLGHATIGFNRRFSYYNGESRMFGATNSPDFSHVEAGTDSRVDVLGVWDRSDRLVGVVVNLACPAQVTGSASKVSADFWHETRQELRRRLGEHLFILPQVGAAGDQFPPHRRTTIGWRGQERMLRLMGIDMRQAIANRLADAVESVLPYARMELQADPVVSHRRETIELPRRLLTEQDVQEALAEARKFDEEYARLLADLEAHPEKRQERNWHYPITAAYRRARWNERVVGRYQDQQQNPQQAVTLHILRLGDVAFATNPFELYLDYGHQIVARSKAVQTFIVELAGSGTYLPTERAVKGGSYSAVPASTPVGPEGGRILVDRTVEAINALWPEEQA